MKIVYLSCHGILEYDEVKLLSELGHDVFCIGDYGGNERPLIPGRNRQCSWLSKQEAEQAITRGQSQLPDYIIDRCDVIISMDQYRWFTLQWNRVKHKRCYLRLIGQHRSGLGDLLKDLTEEGLKIIPYWPSDLKLNGLSAGQITQTVRFYKDENEFTGWTGSRNMVLTVCNDIMRGGGTACHADSYRTVTAGLSKVLVGKGNRFFGDFTARVPYWLLKSLYRECKVYFYIGTEPASYTLNLIEAIMTDMPIVGLDTGCARDLITCSNDPYVLNEMIEELLGSDMASLARYRCRERFMHLFGKRQASEAWSEVLK